MVAVEIGYVARLAVDLPNGFKAGEEIKLKGVSVFEFRDKKIIRLVDFS